MSKPAFRACITKLPWPTISPGSYLIGVQITLEPPDDNHGWTLMNLSHTEAFWARPVEVGE